MFERKPAWDIGKGTATSHDFCLYFSYVNVGMNYIE